jgi:hypothetical protein
VQSIVRIFGFDDKEQKVVIGLNHQLVPLKDRDHYRVLSLKKKRDK